MKSATIFIPILSLWLFFFVPIIAQEQIEIVFQQGHSGGNLFQNTFDVTYDGKYMLSKTEDNVAILWHISSGKELRTFYGHQGSLYSARFSSDYKTVLTSSWDETIRLWETSTGKELRVVPFDKDFMPHEVCFNFDNSKIITIAQNKDYDNRYKGVIIINSQTGESVRKILNPKKDVRNISASPIKNQFLLFYQDGNSVEIYDIDSGKILATLKPGGTIYSGRYSSDGSRMIFCSKEKISLWDASTFKEINSIAITADYADISYDGKYIIAANNGEQVVFAYDVQTKSRVKFQEGFLSPLCFVPNTYSFLADELLAEATAVLIDFRTEKRIKSFKGEKNRFSGLKYIPELPLFHRLGVLPPQKDAPKEIKGEGNYEMPNSVFLKNYLLHHIKTNSPASKLHFVQSHTGFVEIFDTTDNKLLARLAVVKPQFQPFTQPDYIVITPDKYYFATPKIFERVNMVKGMEVLGFENFDHILNRPDIVLQRLGCDDQKLISLYHSAYLKRIRRMRLSIENLSSNMVLPEVKVITDNIPLDTRSKSLTLEVEAVDASNSLTRLNVFVNDVPIYGTKGFPISSKPGEKVKQTVTFELSNGRNKIQVSAVNANGVESHKETREVYYNGVLGLSNLYIIAIGVSEYATSDYNLKYASKDALDISKLLGSLQKKSCVLPDDSLRKLRWQDKISAEDWFQLINVKNKYFPSEEELRTAFAQNLNPSIFKRLEKTLMAMSIKSEYDNVNITTILNRDAVREKILDLKKQLYSTSPDDMVVVFFAGHGLLDNNLDYYLATSDINFERPADRGLKYEELEGLLDGIPARAKILIVDACHSGEVDKESSTITEVKTDVQNVNYRGFKTIKTAKSGYSSDVSDELLKSLFNDLRRGTGTIVIAAAGGAEFAYESSQYSNGVFTFSLIEAIKTLKADSNKNGMITVSELRDYVFSRVQELTQGMQNPTSRQENLEFDFRIW